MKGRKPKPDAVRHPKVEIIPATVIEKPAVVSVNPTLDVIWDECIAPIQTWQPADVPLLISWCTWYAIMLKSGGNVVKQDGRVSTVYVSTDDAGEPDINTAVSNPEIRNLEKATTMLMRIGDQLNLTPAGRLRAGLVDAVTKSTQADVIRKTEAGFEDFKRRLLDA